MRSFMDKDFLLQTETAKTLYHKYAEPLSIVDYHSHLSAKDIAEDRQYNNLTEAWLDTDPYKWRLMRTAGIEEKYITGKDTDPYERFLKFAEILPRAAGNPVFHWSHMELKKFFGFQGLLSAETAKKVWELCNEKLLGPGFSVRGLLTQAEVEVLCTTNDPTEDLRWHKKISEDVDFSMQVLPTMRLDYVLRIEHPQWSNYIKHELAVAAEAEDVATMHDIRHILKRRINYFEKMGCRAADIVLDRMYFAEADEYELISKRQPLFEKSANKNVRYELNDIFYSFWFRFIFKYSYIVEIENYAKLQEIVTRDYNTFSGLMLERYFHRVAMESGQFTRIGRWWDRKGENEIDMIAEDELSNSVTFYEMKRQAAEISIGILKQRAEVMLQSTHEFKNYKLKYQALSMEDM